MSDEEEPASATPLASMPSKKGHGVSGTAGLGERRHGRDVGDSGGHAGGGGEA